MPQQAWKASDFLGLTPGIDPRRSDKYFVLNGENYAFDSIGPRSIFGDRYVTPYPVGIPDYAQGVRISGVCVLSMFGDGIYSWNEVEGGYRLLYQTPNTTIQPNRWTWGYLNGFVYLCHPATGMLVYEIATQRCAPLDSLGAPEHAIACCVNNGRVCVINDLFMFWSAASDGLNWIPKLGGAGFQKISNSVSGNPITITPYQKGVLTWTQGGVMRSEFTADQVVWQHRALNTEFHPVNSFCAVQMDANTVIFLDSRGMFQSQGDAISPFSPIFNEFLIGFIKEYELDVNTNLRLEWDEQQRHLYLSVSLSQELPLFDNAFVLYPPFDKWGQFSQPHYGILPLQIADSDRAGDYYGFVDSTARVRYWNRIGSRETLPTRGDLESIARGIQKPAQNFPDGGGVILSSTATINSVSTASVSGFAGYYERDGDINAASAVTGLSASIQLGLLRIDQQESPDQMIETSMLAIGNVIAGNTDVTTGKYDLTPVFDGEQFGLDDANYVNCGVRVIGSIDGRSVYDSAIPELEIEQAGIRYYSCSCVGVWHILELKAVAIGEAFHLHSFEITGLAAGKVI